MSTEEIIAEGASFLAAAKDSAFPHVIKTTNGAVVNIYGLTKRELFAAMAHAEIVRVLTNRAEADVVGRGELLPQSVEGLAGRYAVAAVMYADALLKELGK